METLLGLTSGWADLYADSLVLEAAVLFAHLGGILVAGGLAIASDRATLRAGGRAPEVLQEHVRELSGVHRPILIALVVTTLSGLALVLADPETFLFSWAFWGKMGLFGLLMVNGLTLRWAESDLLKDPGGAAEWKRLRSAALRSLALWGLVLLSGTLLPMVA